MKQLKRMITLLLAVCLLLTCCVACGNKQEPSAPANESTKESEKTEDTKKEEDDEKNEEDDKKNDEDDRKNEEDEDKKDKDSQGLSYNDLVSVWSCSINVGELIENYIMDNFTEEETEALAYCFERMEEDVFVIDWVWEFSYAATFDEAFIKVTYDNAAFEEKLAIYVEELTKVNYEYMQEEYKALYEEEYPYTYDEVHDELYDQNKSGIEDVFDYTIDFFDSYTITYKIIDGNLCIPADFNDEITADDVVKVTYKKSRLTIEECPKFIEEDAIEFLFPLELTRVQ